jgi:molybdopterin synthase sulfur carrier subunit
MSQVRIPPVLRDVVGGSRELAAGGPTVAAVLDDLFASHPALRDPLCDQGRLSPFVNADVNERDIRHRQGLDTEVGHQRCGDPPAGHGWRPLVAPGLTALLRS